METPIQNATFYSIFPSLFLSSLLFSSSLLFVVLHYFPSPFPFFAFCSSHFSILFLFSTSFSSSIFYVSSPLSFAFPPSAFLPFHLLSFFLLFLYIYILILFITSPSPFASPSAFLPSFLLPFCSTLSLFLYIYVLLLDFLLFLLHLHIHLFFLRLLFLSFILLLDNFFLFASIPVKTIYVFCSAIFKINANIVLPSPAASTEHVPLQQFCMHSMYLHTSYIPNTLGPLTFHSELIEIYSLYYLQIFCGISRF